MNQARLVISGLSGGSGKTLLSLGLVRALTLRGLVVQPCKKGPDYIDAAWLALAAKRPAANLDPYFLEADALLAQFHRACLRPCPLTTLATSSPQKNTVDIAIIEGNRGLYDGRDVRGTCSTAQVALTLRAPVILALNCTKMTRTAAALVAGVATFEPSLNLAGVVINNVGSTRHAALVRQAIEQYTDIPVLGALPRMRHNPLPERHMGLTLHRADPAQEAILDSLSSYVSQHLDMDALLALARSAPPLPHRSEQPDASPFPQSEQTKHQPVLPPNNKNWPSTLFQEPDQTTDQASGQIPGQAHGQAHAQTPDLPCPTDQADGQTDPPKPAPTFFSRTSSRPRIGFVRDNALWFYYEENLEALRQAGADLQELSLLDSSPWPALDGLYLGGGFPELFAPQLAASAHKKTIRALSSNGVPIYAECGGFMLLCQSLTLADGATHAMYGVLPVSSRFYPRPQGLGYVEATTLLANPFHPVGSVWRGHEFHYSRCEDPSLAASFALCLKPGTGMHQQHKLAYDGLCIQQTFASYTHLYAPAVPHWAPNFVSAARAQRA